MIALTASLLSFISVTTLMALVTACGVGVLAPEVAGWALGAGAAAGSWVYFRVRGLRSGEGQPGYFDKAVIFFFLLFCARQFFWIYYKSGPNIWTLNGYPYADFHFHLAFIKNFISNTSFWPENPLFTGAPLRYHFGMDLFTAVAVKAGLPLDRALPLIGFVCGLLTLSALFAWGRGFAVGAFLFTGGMAGYVFFLNGVFDDYQSQLAWKNVALTAFLPQRGFLFGFPAGLMVLWSWRRRLLEKQAGLPGVVEGLFWGVMPLFQIHTFIFLSSIFAVWTVTERKIRQMQPVYFTALIPAVPLILFLTDNFQKSSMIWFKSGWMMEDQNPLIFFLLNFGLYCPLVLWVLCDLVKSGKRRDRFMMIPAAIWFAVLMFVMFGPWEWDNTKLFIWAFLLMLPVIDQRVIRPLPFLWRALLIIGLFASGFVCVVSAMSLRAQGVVLIERQTLDEVCEAVKNIPPETRIATAQEAYHPVLQCGRKVVAGFPGNLKAAFGLKPAEVESGLTRLMNGEFDWRAMARNLGASYLYWGPFEEKSFRESNRPWEAMSLKVAEGAWGALYDLHKPAPWWFGHPSSESLPGQGLRTTIYQGSEWQGTPLSTDFWTEPRLDWEDATRPFPAPVSLLFEGEIYVPESGDVVFFLASDDGSDLTIAGQAVIENLGVHAVRVRRGQIRLEKGWHSLRLRYQDIGGGGTLRLWWKPAAAEAGPIPPAFFRTESEGAA